MSRVAAVCRVLIALVGGSAAPGAHAATASPSAAAQWPCGLPEQQPLWVDFADGSVPFWSSVFARPGVVGAAANLLEAGEDDTGR